MKRTLLLLPLLLCSCSQEPTIVDVIDTSIIIKAAYEHKLEYFYIKTEFAKKDENASYYHTDYIGVDEYHTYYSLEYLSAVKDNELLQIVEVKI